MTRQKALHNQKLSKSELIWPKLTEARNEATEHEGTNIKAELKNIIRNRSHGNLCKIRLFSAEGAMLLRKGYPFTDGAWEFSAD